MNNARPLYVLSIIVVIVSILPTAMAAQTDLTNWNDGDYFDRTADLTVMWDTTQDHASSDTLISSVVQLTDDNGNTVQKEISQDLALSNDETTSNEVTFSSDEFSSLQNGSWTIMINDRWENVTDSEATINIQAGKQDVATTIVSPTDGESYSGGSLEVAWDSLNEYSTDHRLSSAQILIEDSDDNEVSETETLETDVKPGDTASNSITFDGTTLDSLSDGTWTISIQDTWDYDTSSESVDISASRSSDGLSGTVESMITSPSSTTEYTIGDDLSVEWTASNNLNQDHVFEYSEIRVEGASGRSVTATAQENTEIASGDSKENSVDLSGSNLTDLDQGEWSVQITDYWANDLSNQTSVSFDATDATASEITADVTAPDIEETFYIDSENRQITPEVTIQNENIDQEIQTDIEIEDTTAERVTAVLDTDFSQGETRTLDQTFSHDELSELNIPGTWTISVESEGQDTGNTATTEVSLDVDETPDSGIQIDITNIEDDQTLTLLEDDREVRPNLAISNIGDDATIDIGVNITDGSETISQTFESNFDADETKTFIRTFGHDELSALDSDTSWTVSADAEKDVIDTTDVTFQIQLTSNESDVTDFEPSNETDTDENNSSSEGVTVTVNTDSDQGIDPDNRELDVGYSITNDAQPRTHDITIEVSDGTLTAEKTVERDFQAQETRSLKQTFTHETLKALDIDEPWQISVSVSGTDAGIIEDTQSIQPNTAVQDQDAGDDDVLVRGDQEQQRPLLPILLVVLVALVAGIIVVYRRQNKTS